MAECSGGWWKGGVVMMYAIVDATGRMFAMWTILGTQPEIYTRQDDAELVARMAYQGRNAEVIPVVVTVKGGQR